VWPPKTKGLTWPAPASAFDTVLFNSYGHGLLPGERLDARLGEPGLVHPGLAVGACEIETARCFYQHVQAHKEAHGVLAPFVVDHSLINDQRPAPRKRGKSLLKQHAFLRQIPVMENVAHDEDIGRRQRIGEEISSEEFDPIRHTAPRNKLFKDGLDLGQIKSCAQQSLWIRSDFGPS